MPTAQDAALAPAPLQAGRGSPAALLRQGIADLLSRRRLIRYLVQADLKRTHTDTLVGRAWWILDPLLQMTIYWVLFALIFQRKIDDFALFLFAAILPWKWLASTLGDSATSVSSRTALVRQVQFPKLVLPAASVGAGTIGFGFGLIALAVFFIPYHDRLSPWLLTLPLVAAVQVVFVFALAIAVAALNAFYRDVGNILGHALRLWFYLSPGLYSLDQLPEGWVRTILSLNPMAPILESYRRIIWGTDSVPHGVAPLWAGLAVVLVVSLVLSALTIVGFKRAEPAFARILA
jgi:lipopolysaccharide transport system permease protein/teichoic acid transport system permease protein